jgi:hypothetical protein
MAGLVPAIHAGPPALRLRVFRDGAACARRRCALCSPSAEYQRVAMQIRRAPRCPVEQKFGRAEDINHLSATELPISKLFQIFIWTGYETSKGQTEKNGIARF